ncbi:hypothetical protein [Desertivirga arenae]|uniref:hypothetical protein n=1 Tax=Desertivirga arenae TaxID=2810309 RepID=UPI001A97C46A|nr:hypothetical protein [Pedobacter sp. SYSU D00823]
MEQNKQQLALALITSLFFLWCFTSSLNPAILYYSKETCQLTDNSFASIECAICLGYFLLAVPASRFMHKYNYKQWMILGLLLFAAGAFLFYPAAATGDYSLLLFAIVIIMILFALKNLPAKNINFSTAQ